MITGVCKYCRCSEKRACPGGCSWFDAAQTICTACLDKMPEEELLDAAVAEHNALAGIPFQLNFGSGELVSIVGMVQMSLRHPEMPHASPMWQAGQLFAAGVRGMLAAERFHAIAELIRRGGNADAIESGSVTPVSPIILP